MKRPKMRSGVRREILAGAVCFYCGADEPTDVDHVTPVSRGGGDDRDNLVPACFPCNNEKNDRTPDEWRDWRVQNGLVWPPVRPDKRDVVITTLRSMNTFTTNLQAALIEASDEASEQALILAGERMITRLRAKQFRAARN